MSVYSANAHYSRWNEQWAERSAFSIAGAACCARDVLDKVCKCAKWIQPANQWIMVAWARTTNTARISIVFLSDHHQPPMTMKLNLLYGRTFAPNKNHCERHLVVAANSACAPTQTQWAQVGGESRKNAFITDLCCRKFSQIPLRTLKLKLQFFPQKKI